MIRPILYIIVIVVSLGFAFLNVRPAYYRMEARRASLESLNTASDSTGRIRELIGQTEKELSVLNPTNLEKFNVFLPETIDDVRFINNLSHIGILNGIVLENISIKKDEKTTDSSQRESVKTNLLSLSAFPFFSTSVSIMGVSGFEKKYITTKASFSFISTYGQALLFLDSLEKSLGLINITALSFSPQEQKSGVKMGVGTAYYQYKLEIETYSLRAFSPEVTLPIK